MYGTKPRQGALSLKLSCSILLFAFLSWLHTRSLYTGHSELVITSIPCAIASISSPLYSSYTLSCTLTELSTHQPQPTQSFTHRGRWRRVPFSVVPSDKGSPRFLTSPSPVYAPKGSERQKVGQPLVGLSLHGEHWRM